MSTVKRIFSAVSLRQAFFKGSAALAVTTAMSYALGLLRDRLLAQHFGASSTLDAYNAAFLVPDLLLNVFVASALVAAFVPIFTELMKKEGHAETSDFISSVINGSLLVIIISGVIVFITAPYLAHIVVPGLSPESKDLFVNLTRLLLLSPLFFAVSNTLGNIILTKQKFFWYGIATPLYNVGTILGIILLSKYVGIYGAAIGTVTGAALHLISRFIGMEHIRFKYHPKISFSEHYRQFLRLMVPRTVSQPMEQFTFLGFNAIASTISAGAIVILNFAHNFQSAPINIVGVTMGLAIFPTLSKLALEKDRRSFSHEIRFTLKSILAVTIPGSILLYLISRPLISLVLGSGHFGNEAVTLTATTLGVFALSIPTESISQILARGFYALKNSWTPVIISISSLGVALVAGFYLRFMGVPGLALGYFFGSVFKTIMMLWLLRREVHVKLMHIEPVAI